MVRDIDDRARARAAANAAAPPPGPASAGSGRQTLPVCIGSQALAGDLTLVPQARGLVVLAYDSGSSRHHARSRFVADILHGETEKIAREQGVERTHITLAHDAGMAVAQVVLEGYLE